MISPPPFLSSSLLGLRAAASAHPSPPPSPRLHAPPLSASFSAAAAAAAATAPEAAVTAASLYDVLGLPAGASPVEIKAAYRRLARNVHPDAAAAAASASAEDFIRLHAAYATLSDPDKRADYDRRVLSLGGVPSPRRYPSPPPPPPPPPHTAAGRYPSFARSPSFPGYYRRSRRTWETDQCW